LASSPFCFSFPVKRRVFCWILVESACHWKTKMVTIFYFFSLFCCFCNAKKLRFCGLMPKSKKSKKYWKCRINLNPSDSPPPQGLHRCSSQVLGKVGLGQSRLGSESEFWGFIWIYIFCCLKFCCSNIFVVGHFVARYFVTRHFVVWHFVIWHVVFGILSFDMLCSAFCHSTFCRSTKV
jgi:hypothetical protein